MSPGTHILLNIPIPGLLTVIKMKKEGKQPWRRTKKKGNLPFIFKTIVALASQLHKGGHVGQTCVSDDTWAFPRIEQFLSCESRHVYTFEYSFTMV